MIRLSRVSGKLSRESAPALPRRPPRARVYVTGAHARRGPPRAGRGGRAAHRPSNRCNASAHKAIQKIEERPDRQVCAATSEERAACVRDTVLTHDTHTCGQTNSRGNRTRLHCPRWLNLVRVRHLTTTPTMTITTTSTITTCAWILGIGRPSRKPELPRVQREGPLRQPCHRE